MKKSRTLAVAAASTVAAIAVAELSLRLFFPIEYRAPIPREKGNVWGGLVHRPSSVPGLSYELAPNVDTETRGIHIRTNALGMRDDELVPETEPGLVRIAVLGDSVTFGFKVKEARDTYCGVLESLLNEASHGKHRYDVLDFGVGGYSSRDEAAVMHEKVLPLHPRLVIVGYFLNDPECAPMQQLHRFFAEPEWWQHFDLLRLVARAKEQWDRRRLGGGDAYRYWHARDGHKWPCVVESFRSIAEDARGAGAKVLVAIFPTFMGVESFDDYPYTDLHRQVEEEARSHGFEVLDLLPAFRASELPASQLMADREHPNAAGHALAARALFERLVAEHQALLGDAF